MKKLTTNQMLIGGGVIALIYILYRKRKGQNGSNMIQDSLNKKEADLRKVEIENLARQSADEMVKEIEEAISVLSRRLETLEKSQDLNNPITRMKIKGYERGLERLKKMKSRYADIYIMFKKGASNFKNLENYKIAKNILIKFLTYGDSGSNTKITKEEKIFLANNTNLKSENSSGIIFGFNASALIGKGVKKPKFIPTDMTNLGGFRIN